MRAMLDSIATGSSPRVRGTHNYATKTVVSNRFIPACAGNTGFFRARRIFGPVHPRVCGEHPEAAATAAGAAGSSPRVRGTRRSRPHPSIVDRFIPACAGNTIPRDCSGYSATVHPRVCGEHRETAAPEPGRFGSSPRVRGTHSDPAPGVQRPRFIPACAGNTMSPTNCALVVPVHPRVCGEHAVLIDIAKAAAGSSPRVRGTRHHVRHVRHEQRFIPACAGNTERGADGLAEFAVHPRVCGEHARRTARRTRSGRFIPACAGNTVRRPPRAPRAAVHPRVCGEHAVRQVRCAGDAGSSPRVRGTRHTSASAAPVTRFIPACAGNTLAGHGQPRAPRGSSPRVRGTPRLVSRCKVTLSVHPRVCGEHERN